MGVVTLVVEKEKGLISWSDPWTLNFEKSMESAWRRGGVPVFILPISSPMDSRLRARPVEANSPARPAWILEAPIWTVPRKKVPVVMTTQGAKYSNPVFSAMPLISSCSMIKDSTMVCLRSRFSAVSRTCFMFREYMFLSFWVRVDWTAGPLRVFRVLYWIAEESDTFAIQPPRASISLTSCPLAVPPMEGLQGMAAILSMSMVSKRVLQPMRAAARAASHPACPAPTTMTSYLFLKVFITSLTIFYRD